MREIFVAGVAMVVIAVGANVILGASGFSAQDVSSSESVRLE